MNTSQHPNKGQSILSDMLLLLRLAPKVISAWLFIFGILSVGAAEYRGIWVDSWGNGFLSQSQVDTLLGTPGTATKGQVRDANCNAVFVQVRRRADVCYPSALSEPYMTGLTPTNFNALAAIIKAAHDTTGGKKRIEVHCWFVAFKTDKKQVYSLHSDRNNPDNYWPTRIGSTSGNENADGSFDPGHPKALQYLVNASMDLVNFQTTAGTNGTDGNIDGIHYDYIRFEASNEGYNPTSVARFNQRYGFTGEPASTNALFKQWRRDAVTALVRQVYAKTQKAKPSVRLSGSFITWNSSPTNSTREAFMGTRPYYDIYSDWDSWVQEGIVDMAVPMTYYDWASLPNDYTRWMNFEKDRKGNRHMIIGPGTYHNNLDNAILELLMTRDPSPANNYAHGFSAYCYRNPYYIYWSDPTYGTVYGSWANFAARMTPEVTPTWDDIPPMPWKTDPTNGHVMGVVALAGSGAWADHATVNITGPVNRSMYVDGTGFYAFIDLPPGSYQVTASKPGYLDSLATVNVAVGEVTGNMYERNLVLSTNSPPIISGQPQNQTVGVSSNATFTVTASGSQPLKYQWRFNNAVIQNATNSAFTRTNAQLSHAGSYTVVVTNVYGAVTSSPALLTVLENLTPPTIAAQPQSTNVVAGQTATFHVVALGSFPLLYQWRFQGNDLANARNSTLTLTNAQLAQAGSYTVVITNVVGCVTSHVASLTVFAPPSITLQPESQGTTLGQDALFAAEATGTLPLYYQWRFAGQPVPNATTSQLSFSAVTMDQAGSYDLVVTNSYGSVTSQTAVLTVLPPPPPIRLVRLWSLAPYSRTYLTTNELPNERGLTYNPATHHLLLASRTTTNIFVLNPENGAHLYQMNMSGLGGGQYGLLLINAAEDGAVYACNLSTGSAQPFKLYRWANDSSNTTATVAFNGNPLPTRNDRWGDSFDVRGAGTNTQIIIAPRLGTNVIVFTTTNGLNFTPNTVRLLDAPAGHCSLGLAFGAGNTFWGTSHTNALRQFTFSLSSGVATTTTLCDTSSVPTAICPIGISTSLNMLGGVHVYSPNHLRIYSLASGTPVQLGGNFNFLTDNSNTHTGAGAVDFSSNTVFALDANNGLTAVRFSADPPCITLQPQTVTAPEAQTVVFSVQAGCSTGYKYEWSFNGVPLIDGNGITGATSNVLIITGVSVANGGDYAVKVSTPWGSINSSTATLTLLTPPNITSQPQSQTVLGGSNAPFNVLAVGSEPLSYQWRFNSASIDGATNSFFIRTNAQSAHAGSYDVVVSNPVGSLISSNAVLVVDWPVKMLGLEKITNGWRLAFTGDPSRSNLVEYSTTLTNWFFLTNAPFNTGSFELVDPAEGPQRFYRVRQP